MTQTSTIDRVIDAYVQLSEDEQDDRFDRLKQKRIELGRARIRADMVRARRELAEGKCRVMTAEEIVREAFS